MRTAPRTEVQLERDQRLKLLVKESIERFDALSPEEQRAHRAAQRKSWVVGNFMLDHPEATREYAEAIYEKVA